jgi:hypothetical protein
MPGWREAALRVLLRTGRRAWSVWGLVTALPLATGLVAFLRRRPLLGAGLLALGLVLAFFLVAVDVYREAFPMVPPPSDRGLANWRGCHHRADDPNEVLPFPGVSLGVESLDGRTLQIYKCQVVEPGGSVAFHDKPSQKLAGQRNNLLQTIESKDHDELMYPGPYAGFFRDAPPMPLPNGIYRVWWWALGDVGEVFVTEHRFRIKRGSLVPHRVRRWKRWQCRHVREWHGTPPAG